MDIIIKASQFILSLSILIVLHEFGHFIPARLFGTRVEKFYLFFNPWFSVVKKKIGDTEWGIGWVPLGGYVKISGMIDESMDKDQLEKPAEPWEFRAKPAWQRLIIMLGGVIVNVIVGFVIYMMIVGIWGKNYIPKENLTHGVYASELANTYGIETGDNIVSIDGKEIKSIKEVDLALLLKSPKTISYTKKNSEELITKELSEDIEWDLFTAPNRNFVSMPVYTIVDSLPEDSKNIGKIQKGDSLVAVNGVETIFFQDFSKSLKVIEDSIVKIDYYREGVMLSDSLLLTDGKIGFVTNGVYSRWYADTTEFYGFGGSISEGSSLAWETFKGSAVQLKFLFSKKGTEEIGGFMSMGRLFKSEWDWRSFWALTAMLSMVLAVMNVLPIPALDGGHVLFLLYEMITGREPHKKFLEYAQIVGMVILFGLLLYANGNDIFKAITGKF